MVYKFGHVTSSNISIVVIGTQSRMLTNQNVDCVWLYNIVNKILKHLKKYILTNFPISLSNSTSGSEMKYVLLLVVVF